MENPPIFSVLCRELEIHGENGLGLMMRQNRLAAVLCGRGPPGRVYKLNCSERLKRILSLRKNVR